MKGKQLTGALVLCILLAGCIGGRKPEVRLKEDRTLEGVLQDVEDEFGDQGVSMAVPVDERALEELFHIQAEDAEEYAGVYSMSFTNADHLIAIRARPGRGGRVRSGLEQRKKDVLYNFKTYLPEQYQKAEAGKIGNLGDYWFLIIIGAPDKDAEEEVDRAWKTVQSGFITGK